MDMQRTLFDSTDVTQERVRSILEPHYPAIYRTVMLPWQGWLSRRRDDSFFRHFMDVDVAWFMHRQMLVQAELEFDGSDATPVTNGQMFAMNIQGELLICFKKLRMDAYGRLRRSNHRQMLNERYWGQRSREGFPDLPRLLVGYLPANLLTDISIHIAYPSGRSMRWAYRMPDQPQSIFQISESSAAKDEAQPEEKGFRVTARNDSERDA